VVLDLGAGLDRPVRRMAAFADLLAGADWAAFTGPPIKIARPSNVAENQVRGRDGIFSIPPRSAEHGPGTSSARLPT